MSKFTDGIKSIVNDLANIRNGLSTNQIAITNALDDTTKRQIYRTGIGNKIVRIKSGTALKDTLQFDNKADGEIYDKKLSATVKKAVKQMLWSGRGAIVIYMPGDDISKPLNINNIDVNRVRIESFSNDLVSPNGVELNLDSERYYKPNSYTIRGRVFHPSRVIDFTYVEPPEFDAPSYRYGGISEFELIYAQLINDGIIERASSTIIEKASTFIYKITGFKDSIRAKKEKDVLNYFSTMEDARSIYGSVLLDAEDDATAVNQQLNNLSEINDMSLRRLAMVTGLTVSWLVGENVKGLNATGDNERLIFQDMIESLQSDYILTPLNQLFSKLGLGPVKFKENQGETPAAKIDYESKAIENAIKLWQMGEDHSKYLEQKGVIEADEWEDLFSDIQEPLDSTTGRDDVEGLISEDPDSSENDMNVGPQSSLNGAQVTAILEIIRRIREGEISKPTAKQVITTSFPVSESEANELIKDVTEEIKGQDNE